jgi:transcriptional regulator with XRE-family HTH domain
LTDVIKEITLSPRKLGVRIKRFREQRGWTQTKLATKIGVSRVHLANIESPDDAPHHRVPSLATLEKLAKALRVKVADLLK